MSGTLVLSQGKVYPFNGIVRLVEAVSIRAGQITRLGSNAVVNEGVSPQDQHINLGNYIVTPSFSDSFARLGLEAFARSTLDLSLQKTIPEIFGIVEKSAREHPNGTWIVGCGWNKMHWGWHRFPHRADLDLVSPHHPVVLFSADHRVAWLNSEAIAQIGLRHDTLDPKGGEIERDPATRAATGILKEKALQILEGKIPQPQEALLREKLNEIFQDYFALGVTCVETMALPFEFELLHKMDAEWQLPLQVVCHLPYDHNLLASIDPNWKTGTSFNRLRLGGIWVAADGTLGSQTAFLNEPYADDWNKFGLQILTLDEIREIAQTCFERGFSPIFHASGDSGVQSVIEAVASIQRLRNQPQPVLVHGDLVDPILITMAARTGFSLITNPHRIESEMEIGSRYWGNRWRQALNLRKWQDQGVPLLFGSGEPLRWWDPMRIVYSAVHCDESRDFSCHLNPEEAFAGLTSCFRPHRDMEPPQGFLSPSRPASLVILSQDPFQSNPEDLSSIRILATIMDGQIVFDREGLFS